MRPLCIYHASCLDGFAAAWVVREVLGGEVDFFEGRYGEPLPDEIDNRDAILVDFSYRAPELAELARGARTVLLIDHHKTCMEELAKLARPYWPTIPIEAPYDPRAIEEAGAGAGVGTAAQFVDMERSGAGLAWDFFFPHKPRPRFIDHVEDRDLWRFKIDGTREFTAALASYPQDFPIWSGLVHRVDELIAEGASILRFRDQKVSEIAETAVERTIAGHAVLVANAPYAFTSDVANMLATERSFGATYFDRGDVRQWSLRSHADGADVSEIAKQFGGGGHLRASGFETPNDFTAPLALAHIAALRSGDGGY